MPSNRAASCTKEVIDHWFDLVNQKLLELDLFDKPFALWNVDEGQFASSVGQSKVICKRGAKNPNRITVNNEKIGFTVQGCCKCLPPYILFKATNLYNKWCLGGLTGTMFNTSQSGWMEEQTFYAWFTQLFIQKVADINGSKVLFMDGHNSHISLRIIDAAIENNIHILCLPSHSSHLLQPLDVGV